MTEFLTAQQVFDKVSTHLLTQNEPAIDKDGNCMYKLGSLSCAVGCLIKDEFYKQKFEFKGIGAGEKDLIYALEQSGINVTEQLRLLSQLQNIHDKHPTPDWYESLMKLAEYMHLSSSVINTIFYR
jgi:hypothetical protein